jgi:hypothetical protein
LTTDGRQTDHKQMADGVKGGGQTDESMKADRRDETDERRTATDSRRDEIDEFTDDRRTQVKKILFLVLK